LAFASPSTYWWTVSAPRSTTVWSFEMTKYQFDSSKFRIKSGWDRRYAPVRRETNSAHAASSIAGRRCGQALRKSSPTLLKKADISCEEHLKLRRLTSMTCSVTKSWTRAATLMELCQLATSFDASDHLTHPLFRPLVFPSKYDRQWLSPPQKVMFPAVMTRFAWSRSRFLKISDCNVWNDDQRLSRFPDRPAHWQSKRVWMEQPEAGVWPEKVLGPIGIEWKSWHLETVECRWKREWMAQNVAIDDPAPTFWLSGDQNAFKKVVSKNRLIKTRSKSESFEIRVESIEAKNGID
jgi:hypothetical protein